MHQKICVRSILRMILSYHPAPIYGIVITRTKPPTFACSYTKVSRFDSLRLSNTQADFGLLVKPKIAILCKSLVPTKNTEYNQKSHSIVATFVRPSHLSLNSSSRLQGSVAQKMGHRTRPARESANLWRIDSLRIRIPPKA